MRLPIVIGWLLLAFLSPAQADEWPAAQEKTYQSQNGLYHVRVIPGNSFGDTVGFSGAQKGKYAQVVLTGPGPRDERSFALLNPVAPVEAILLDDGSLVTFDNWHNAGYGKVVVLYDREGTAQWSYELEQLLSAEVLKLVPHSVSSRWWRKSPVEWKLEEGAGRAAIIRLTLWNEDQMKFHLPDGKVEYAAIEHLGNDPQRLLKRAQALSDKASGTQGSYESAVATFKRAIALDPHLVEAYRGLGEAYKHQGDYPHAIAILQEGIHQNPISDSVTSESGWQSDQRMWLRLELAWVYEQTDQSQEAEKTLEDCLQLDPAFWEAGKTLAKLWMKAGRRDEADALLTKFFELKRGDEGHWNFGYNLSKASYDVGAVYEEYGDNEQAKEYYLKAYGRADVDQFLYQHLAEVYEKLGEPNKTLEVLETLKAWMQQQNGYEEQLKRLEERIAHLRSGVPTR